MRELKIIISVCSLLFIAPWEVYSQQIPQFTQNMFAEVVYNPAMAGIKDGINATGLYRQQWVGFKDAEGNTLGPETFLITLDAPIKFLHGGVGLSIMDDKLGYEKNLAFKLDYAFHSQLGDGDLNIGLVIGFQNHTLDASLMNPANSSDPLIANLGGEASSMIVDGGFGVYYSSPSNYWVGLSALQLLGSKSNFGTDYSVQKNEMHYYLMGGYNYTFKRNPQFELLPMILFKSDGSTFQCDVNALVRYNKKVWGGVTYRLQDAIALMVGFSIKDFKVGYSYDITTNGLGSSGTHEIMINYCFKLDIKKTPKSYKNTRFL